MRSQLKREIISVVLNGERVLFVRQQKQKGKTKKMPQSLSIIIVRNKKA